MLADAGGDSLVLVSTADSERAEPKALPVDVALVALLKMGPWAQVLEAHRP